MRAASVSIVLALGACSAAPADDITATSCVDEVQMLLTERAALVETGMDELGVEDSSDTETIDVQELSAEDLKATEEADFAAASQELRKRYEDMQLEDMQPWLEFMQKLEQQETRIRFAASDCPEAAKLMQEADRMVPLRVKMP